MVNFLFTHLRKDKEHTIALLADTIKEAKEIALSINDNLVYIGYQEEEQEEEQKVMFLCAKTIDELTFPFNFLKRVALFLAPSCQCCAGYRILIASLIAIIAIASHF